MKKLLLFLFMMTSIAVWAQGKAVFTIDKSKLIDAAGQVFVIRGMNNPHAWFGKRHIRRLMIYKQ